MVHGGDVDQYYKFGAILSGKDFRDYKAVCCASNNEFPEKFELDMPSVKNQGNVSSCVAHALSTVIEYFNKKQLNMDERMSTGYIYGNRSTSIHKGKGMVVRDALSVVRLYGDVTKKVFPDNIEVPKAIEEYMEKADELYEEGYKYRISSYCRLKNEADIKQALMANGPVIIAMKWYSDIKVKRGVLTSSFDKKYEYGSHCMVLYGWDSRGWKVQNSWGGIWGNKGRCVIPYDTEIAEFWTVTDDIIDGMDIVKPYNSSFGKIIAKILNAFWKLFTKKK